MFRAGFVADVVPGIVLVAASYVAALPAFRIVRQSSRGRARGAMAWLFGFLVGVITTMLLCFTTGEVANPDAQTAACGLLGAFVGPFIGILHGKWLGPLRKRRRPPELGEGLPR
jgi:glycerol uptake facilitator-like aquaporin